MAEKESTTSTDKVLLQKWKQLKLYYVVTNASLVMLVLITIARVIMYGFGYFIFLPVFVAVIAVIIGANYKAIDKEIKAKNLN